MPRLLVIQSLTLAVALTAVCGAQQPPAPPAEPPAPAASPAVQPLLDAATKLAADRKPAGALAGVRKAGFSTAWTRGRSMTLEQANDLAREAPDA